MLAKKCSMEYEKFMSIKKAVYMFAFGLEEKVYIGMYVCVGACVRVYVCMYIGITAFI